MLYILHDVCKMSHIRISQNQLIWDTLYNIITVNSILIINSILYNCLMYLLIENVNRTLKRTMNTYLIITRWRRYCACKEILIYFWFRVLFFPKSICELFSIYTVFASWKEIFLLQDITLSLKIIIHNNSIETSTYFFNLFNYFFQIWILNLPTLDWKIHFHLIKSKINIWELVP